MGPGFLSSSLTMPLLGAGMVLVLACALATYILLRNTGEDRLLQERIEFVTAFGKGGGNALALPSITRKHIRIERDWRDTLTGILGFSLSKKEQYPIKWPWILGVALIMGRIAVALGSGLFGTFGWILQPIVTIALCRSAFSTMINNRISRLREQFPDALGLIVRAVRVGMPVSEALRAVSRESMAPTAGEFDRLADRIAIGTPIETALREMADRNNLPEYGFFAAALGLQAQTGGGLAETLELLADVTRKRVAMKARGHALSSEARTSSMILGGLPVISGLSLYLINPDYMSLLFTEESGRMVLGGAILSLSIGIFVMRLIIRKSLS